MDYRDILKEDNENAEERYELVIERVGRIKDEDVLPLNEQEYFKSVSGFICMVADIFEDIKSGKINNYSLKEHQKINTALYSDIVGDNYDRSYANPEYAAEKLGEKEGPVLSFIYNEIRGIIVYAYEYRLLEFTSALELFVQIYNLFESAAAGEITGQALYSELKEAVYYYVSDYCDITVTHRIREQLDTSLNFATDIIMNSDLSDLSYLYKYGEYITKNEIKTARFLNTLSQEEINAMASTYTEGYRRGFELAGIDLSKKKTVEIRYRVGFERMIRQAVKNFEKMGLKPTIFRAAAGIVNKRQNIKIGYYGAVPNVQLEFDHRFDDALFLDKPFIERKLAMMKVAYENYKDEALVYAGPAVLETFGEEPENPVSKKSCFSYSEKQRSLSTSYSSEAARIVNTYINGEERSFTIISFPIPEIGDKYEEIFRETIRINTLDYSMYKEIQQKIIDALDNGTAAYIQGRGKNRTSLTVQFNELGNPDKETNFENCLSDVNIPLGEVFTSPKLSGTSGILNVSDIFIDQIEYKDLWLEFTDGKVSDYGCSVFDDENENKALIQENLLFNHDTLPMGEFAIGTNTVAYAMAKKYDIIKRLKILIIEKMGPHFAIGDTCYSHSEEVKVYNPDGKEITARDNECSILRKTEPEKAYFNCHTDITIPYDEIAGIWIIGKDGSRTAVIENGRFVLCGTDELNRALDETDKMIDGNNV